MTNSFRLALQRGLSLAAVAGTSLAGAPVLAAPDATTIAQGYGTTTVEVVEVESVNGWYLTVGAGAIWPSNQNFHFNGTDYTGNLRYGGGFSVDGGLGYDFGALRAELTYGYSAPSLNHIHVHDEGTFDASGKVNKNDVMASLYWDVMPWGRFTPYIGGGVGYSNLSTPSWTVDDVDGTRYRFGSSNMGLFGWQAKAGVSYAATYNLDVYAEGTYSGTEGYSTDLIDTQTYNDFGAKLGFRYRFAQPAAVVVVPEPAPAPAPEPAPMPAPEPAPAPAPEPIRGLW